ncbi:MAG: CDP-glycerol glycerophosphotransferase family protein [Desulfocapsa sp.]|nr:CDP-glycerol glycerophosphotransferase family protein [Desulfocapsa sp.]
MISFSPKFSVIIPVYNTVDYLEECLDSVLNQTINDLEVIVIDDGSTDGCWEIIQEYAARHSRIRAFQQDRKRQGAARNLGLRHARGEFIGFLDSDDKLPLDIYEYMYELACKYTSDIVVGIQQSFNGNRMWRGVKLHADGLTDKVRNIASIAEFPELLTDISVCNKIISHKLIIENNIIFPEGCSGEDLHFMVRSFLVAQNITVIPRVSYYYRGRQNATTSIPGEYLYRGRVENTIVLEPFFEENNLHQFYSVLLCSELKKLVNTRLSKTIQLTQYPERRVIFNLITQLAVKLDDHEIRNSNYFSSLQQVRAFLIKREEYDCLEMFDRKPFTPGYLDSLKNKESYWAICSPILDVYIDKISTLKLEKERADSVCFLKLLRVPTKVRTLFQRFQQLLRRRRAAKIPFYAIFSYCALYPIAWIKTVTSKKKDVWLIEERRANSAADNSYFLFRYLRTQHPELKVYYVIRKDSPDYERVAKLGRSIVQYSVAHAYYLHCARVLLSTESLRNLGYPAEILRKMWGKTYNVFLQHGVMAVKRTAYTQKKFFYFSQIITSSDREKEIFVQEYNFPDSTVAVTGIARFDNLMDEKGLQEKLQILVVPTWRRGMNSRQEIESSKYYWAWNQLLVSEKLVNLLEKYNATLIFRLHQNLLPFASEFAVDSERVRVLSGHEPPLFQLIKESALFITDYSSVMFDFFYQDKPAICYMFDKEELEQTHKGQSHIDIKTELPADVQGTCQGVLSSLENYLINNCTLSVAHRAKAADFFKYRDDNNCERIYQSIIRGIK